MRPIAIPVAEATLLSMLRDDGVDPAHATVGQVWPVFLRFAEVPVKSASDGLLYQSGVFDFDGPERFYIDFVRQFEVLDSQGRHDYFEQLHCEFQFDPDVQPEPREDFEVWCFPAEGDSLDEFIMTVEGRIELGVVRDRIPVAVSISQEPV